MLKLASFLLAFLLIGIKVDASSDNLLKFSVNCTTNYTADSNYQFILYNLLGRFTSQASKTGFYIYSSVEASRQVYGLYMCRGDILGQDCNDCVNTAKNDILESCPYSYAAIIWYDKRMIRFSPNSFFGILSEASITIVYNARNVTGNQTEFAQILGHTMSTLAVQIARDSLGIMYGARVVNISQDMTLYAMEQCTNDLAKNDCLLCLRNATMLLFPYSRGSRILSPSCVARYEIYPFFRLSTNTSSNNTPPSTSIDQNNNSDKSAKGRWQLIVIALSIASVGTLLTIIGICICMRKKEMNDTSTAGEMDEIKMVESLQFEWNTIKAATHNFSANDKLGEGGFGEVFKGILEDGQEVAVKRLSENSGQGIVEFKTEITVVAKLQHKNLVKLLGFCLAQKEKLLIYEYLPNSSLDRFISDRDKRLSMIWDIRYKIIAGVARGLLYLHEDSRLKIIHRDLKSSNILLDESMNPKIADFGLARLFEVDQTQGDTKRIVGTYGYMAPEYAMTGHFSVKSDVYSFGVIVLEIVSGQKNRFHGRSQLEEALLHRAWRLWNEGSPLNLLDTSLGTNYPTEEVAKCIHIGLLCIQDNAMERPRMASVVAALNGQSISLPMPKAPTFLGDPRTTEPLVHYNQLNGSDDIGYFQTEANDKDCQNIYTGTQWITDELPR